MAPSRTAGLQPTNTKNRQHAGDPRARIDEILRQVPDPEIPALSVVDLGIVREISEARVVITPTYTGCPATLYIEQNIRAALDAAGLAHVRIETILSPPWSSDWISEQGREKLRAYGIAPPPRGAGASSLKNDAPAQCPRCGSCDSVEISRFASTPCKALWRCKGCAEPFDRFKCH
jgi:ring-1,2-phenylacetyl-CoA epoxidase subunit PaaD